MPNRLADSASPYLLQHKDNPVDWWEWSDEAFAAAAERDVPVLLSVGYAACHWCHVMAGESFEDPATAAVMNAGFVNVKVDREERPDVDAAYMQATTALTGHGGWPMTVFLTPDGRPFHAGTYFPPIPRHGLASFGQLLDAITAAWRDRRGEIDALASRLAGALSGGDGAGAGIERAVMVAPDRPTIAAEDAAAAVRALARDVDEQAGGFGGAPKFPPSMVLEFLLRHAASDSPVAGAALTIADDTLLAMAHSGMYDQVAGGFARYAVDRHWVVPHFEKMLYDNAQLARVYLHWWRLTGKPTARRIAEETCDWMLLALTTAQGGLASSLDADTALGASTDEGLRGLAAQLPSGGHGVEGLTYVWTPEQLHTVLGATDGPWAADLLGVTAGGSFEGGASTARLTRDVWADPSQAQRWVDVRGRLLTARQGRPQPERDDKVVAAWNGLAVAALAECGVLLDRPDLLAAAQRVATVLVERHIEREGGSARLRRVSREGRVGRPAGVLEDYGDVAEGLLVLGGLDGRAMWFEVALELLETVRARFIDVSAPGILHDVADDALDAPLATMRRPRDPGDNAYPSGGSAATGALLRAAALTGRSDYRELAEGALTTVRPLLVQTPRFAGWWWSVAQALLDGPREVAVLGPAGPRRDELLTAALASPLPGVVLAVGDPGAGVPPLLADRGLVGGLPAAYVCRGFVCELPETDPARLSATLAATLAAPLVRPPLPPPSSAIC